MDPGGRPLKGQLAFMLTRVLPQLPGMELLCVVQMFLQPTGPPDPCRCAKCNGSFLPDPVGPADVESLQVPEGVLLRQKEFWVCAKCRSVYWKGSQYEAAISRLTQMTTRLSLNSC